MASPHRLCDVTHVTTARLGRATPFARALMISSRYFELACPDLERGASSDARVAALKAGMNWPRSPQRASGRPLEECAPGGVAGREAQGRGAGG